MNARVVVIGVLVLILLVLYLYTMYLEVTVAMNCTSQAGEIINQCRNKIDQTGFGMIFTTVGGMIAAVAVGILAVSDPNDGLPNAGLADKKNTRSQTIAKTIPLVLIGVWLICGVVAIYFGFNYKGSPPLTEMAKAWIGTAVAGVGAFLGIKTS